MMNNINIIEMEHIEDVEDKSEDNQEDNQKDNQEDNSDDNSDDTSEDNQKDNQEDNSDDTSEDNPDGTILPKLGYPAMLQQKLVESEKNNLKYKAYYFQYKLTFTLSTIFMLLFATLFMQSAYFAICLLLGLILYTTKNKGPLVWCHYMCYIILTVIVSLHLIQVLFHVEI